MYDFWAQKLFLVKRWVNQIWPLKRLLLKYFGNMIIFTAQPEVWKFSDDNIEDIMSAANICNWEKMIRSLVVLQWFDGSTT